MQRLKYKVEKTANIKSANIKYRNSKAQTVLKTSRKDAGTKLMFLFIVPPQRVCLLDSAVSSYNSEV